MQVLSIPWKTANKAELTSNQAVNYAAMFDTVQNTLIEKTSLIHTTNTNTIWAYNIFCCLLLFQI